MKKYFEKFGHTCELNYDEKAENLDQGRIKKAKEAFVKWATIDPTSNLTLQHFNSHSSIVNERKFHLENHLMTIHPFSRTKMIWECFIVLVFLCYLVYGPLIFFDYVRENTKTYLEDISNMKSMNIFCIIDMVTRFFTGYVDENNFVVSKKQEFFWTNSKEKVVFTFFLSWVIL